MFKKILLILMLAAVPCFGQGYVEGPDRVKITDPVTGEAAEVKDGGLAVKLQDPHTRALDLRFIMAVGAPSALAYTTVVDAHTVVLADATGFVDGSYILIAEDGDKFYLGTQIGAASNDTITVDSPLDRAYSAGSVVLNTTYNMNVVGSPEAPKIFQIGSAGATTEIDITRIMGYFQDNVTMGDGKFGSLDPLVWGCVLRISNGFKTNTWNIKTNADLALLGFDFTYPPRAPASDDSARFRITYAGQEKHGVTFRLEPGWTLEFIIQDDLSDLTIFNMMAQGHLTD